MKSVKCGEYVTAKLFGKNDCRQGIVDSIGSNSFILLGESGSSYLCEGIPVVISDKDLIPSTMEFVNSHRKKQKGVYFSINKYGTYTIHNSEGDIATLVTKDNPFMWAKAICYSVNKSTEEYLEEIDNIISGDNK